MIQDYHRESFSIPKEQSESCNKGVFAKQKEKALITKDFLPKKVGSN